MLRIKNLTRQTTPRLDYERLVNLTLGAKYELSLVLIGRARSRALNHRWRGKNKPTNVLSFPLSPTSGEIFLNLNLIRHEASARGESFKFWLTYLVIHGLLHLKGFDHGSKMEAIEQKILKKFFT